MATNLPSCNHADDDCIDMEVSSFSSFFGSPPQTREFEFQMSSAPNDQREPTTSPADELFYKGKLLPLHLPPRLQMVQKLLQNSNPTFENTDPALVKASHTKSPFLTFENTKDAFDNTNPALAEALHTESPFLTFDNTKEAFEDEHYSLPSITNSTTPSTNTSTPLDQSCNISLSESCRVSCELNPDDHFFEWSAESNGFIADDTKTTWSKKLKLVKPSLLVQKLKASRACLKSLFSKTARSDESSAKAAYNAEAGHVSEGKKCVNKYMKVAKNSSFGKIRTTTYPTLGNDMKSIDKRMIENGVITHRKSFSGAIKCPCATKSLSSSSSSTSSGASSLSSSFSISSSGLYELQCLKRSNSMNLEIESSIESAIAHCKQSQQLLSSSKSASEAGL
ncbi:hypothetical protein CsSME_00038539 [Camellia sinensis var. sinensis]